MGEVQSGEKEVGRFMCGRYRLSRRKQLVEEYFASASDEPDWEARYNIASTQPVPIILQNPTQFVRELSMMRWGLVPSWVKDTSGAASMINARSETASTKPAFADAFKHRRCLIPADGFYEWKRTGTSKQPFCFEVNDGALFAFAGLWDHWRDASERWLTTCSILTTTPNALTSDVHDRMPVILSPEDYDVWLDPGMSSLFHSRKEVVAAATVVIARPHAALLESGGLSRKDRGHCDRAFL